MKKLTRAAVLVATFFVLHSCKKEQTNQQNSIDKLQDVSVQDGRISFKNSNVLKETLADLTNKGTTYLNSWEDGKNFSSLRRAATTGEDLEAFDFPQIFSTIINPNGEYVVGDTIVWYHNGFKHMIPKMDEELLAKIKANPSISKIKYTAGSTTISQQNLNPETKSQSANQGKTMQVILGSGVIDARYQKQFYTDVNTLRKIVFEIQNYVESGPIGYNSYLITRIKQEWKGSSWKPAGEAMEKRITNLSYTHGYNNVFNGAYVEVSGTVASVPTSGPQTDGNNLEYMMSATISSNPATVVSVSGNYHALVVAPGNSQGFWDVAATW